MISEKSQWDIRLERLRLFATTLVAVYPIFAGLYIFGFFWSAPFDLIGAFSFTDFLFKSAVTFFCLAAVCVAYIVFLSFYTILIIEKVAGPVLDQAKKDDSEDDEHRRWSDLKRRETWAIVLLNLAILVFLIVVFVVLDENPKLPKLPNFLLGSLIVAPLFGTLVSLSLDRVRWLMVRIAYWVTVGLVVPFWFGYKDFELAKNPVKVLYEKEQCAVRFIGGEKALIKCGSGDKLIDVGEATVSYPVTD